MPTTFALEVNMPDRPDVVQALSHVLWIGGSPCSGKSTISHTIARIYVFVDYHVDAWSGNHLARQIAAGDAEATAFVNMSIDQRWIERSVETLTSEALSQWTRGFPLVIEDLLALPKETFTIAEGNFFPACVAPYLSSPHQAIWLVPTDAFCEQGRQRKWAELAIRQKRHGVYDEGSDPETHRRNIIARDRRLARYVQQQAEDMSLTVHVVDGSRSREEMTELVERHFDPYLIARFQE
jgi:adenylate kinase family enzyme